MVGLDRAIVSPVAGTTRDYLEAPCECDGLGVDLVDTAGDQDPTGSIEARAQSARVEQSSMADLLIDCRAGDHASDQPAIPSAPPRLLVGTKADLFPSTAGRTPTSASTGEGLESLRRAIAEALGSRSDEGDLPAGTATRCGESLSSASRSLRSAARTLRAGGGEELVAVDLRQALDDLGRVVGAVVTDDLLERIFRRFCIGK